MFSYIIRRLLLVIPTLIGISLVSFLLLYLSGDPTTIILGPETTVEAQQAFRQRHGLDKPLWVQYYRYCFRIVKGDFGTSLRFDQPAGQLVAERVRATAELAAAALLLSIVFGIPAGVMAAYRQKTPIDSFVRGFSILGQAVPVFYLGILCIVIFGVWLGLLPTGGRESWKNIVLPAFCLAGNLLPLTARVTRSCMLDVFRKDYIRTARSKGLTERIVLQSHALRNALIPVVTVIGLQLGFMMGGVVVTEIVFSWPGMGQLAITSIYSRDFPVTQAVVFLAATIFIFVNLIVDVLYAFLDPRISYH